MQIYLAQGIQNTVKSVNLKLKYLQDTNFLKLQFFIFLFFLVCGKFSRTLHLSITRILHQNSYLQKGVINIV